jgi:hypothetical protein
MAPTESLEQTLSSALSLAQSDGLTETARVTLLEATTRLMIALQKPEDALIKLTYVVRL